MTTLTQVLAQVTFIGDGATVVELGHFLARLGTEVTIVRRGPCLLEREDPALDDLIAELLTAGGIDVRTGVRAHTVRGDTRQTLVELDDGTRVETGVVINAAGRTPNTAALNVEAVGV